MSKKIILGKREVLFTSNENLNFPRYFQSRNGRRLLYFSQGFHGVTERQMRFRSDDGGKTWVQSREPEPNMMFEFDDGTQVALGSGMYRLSHGHPERLQRHIGRRGGHLGADPTAPSTT